MVPPMLYEAITELIKNTPTPKIAAKPIAIAGSRFNLPVERAS